MNKGIHYWAGINKYFQLNIDLVIFCASWHQRYNELVGTRGTTGGTQREYSSKPFKYSIVKRIFVFKR